MKSTLTRCTHYLLFLFVYELTKKKLNYTLKQIILYKTLKTIYSVVQDGITKIFYVHQVLGPNILSVFFNQLTINLNKQSPLSFTTYLVKYLFSHLLLLKTKIAPGRVLSPV